MEPPELQQFYTATKTLREALEEDLRLNDFDRISLENYMSWLQLTYADWKRRNIPYKNVPSKWSRLRAA